MFILYKEKLKLADDAAVPPSLTKLMKDDKANALKWALYVFLRADRTGDNPIKDIPEPRNPKMAKTLAFGDKNLFKKEHLELAEKAVTEYKKDHYDETQADIDLYDKKMVEFMQLLEETKPVIVRNVHDTTGKVSFTTNVDIITSILDNVIKIIIDKATMVGLQKSGNSIVHLRGGLSPNNKGKLLKMK